MKFIRDDHDKCQVLLVEGRAPCSGAGRSAAEEALDVLLDGKLGKSQQCTLATKQVEISLHCTKRIMACSLRVAIFLLSSDHS